MQPVQVKIARKLRVISGGFKLIKLKIAKKNNNYREKIKKMRNKMKIKTHAY